MSSFAEQFEKDLHKWGKPLEYHNGLETSIAHILKTINLNPVNQEYILVFDPFWYDVIKQEELCDDIGDDAFDDICVRKTVAVSSIDEEEAIKVLDISDPFKKDKINLIILWNNQTSVLRSVYAVDPTEVEDMLNHLTVEATKVGNEENDEDQEWEWIDPKFIEFASNWLKLN